MVSISATSEMPLCSTHRKESGYRIPEKNKEKPMKASDLLVKCLEEESIELNVSVYNHQLCLLDPYLYPFNRKSISDWKNEYMPECEGCTKQEECGGFFSSAKLRYSKHITPFK